MLVFDRYPCSFFSLNGKKSLECLFDIFCLTFFIGFIYIICVYRLHKSNDETFCQELEDLTESLDNPCLIFGDFNYNCFAYNNVEINNHDNIMKYINMFMSNGFPHSLVEVHGLTTKIIKLLHVSIKFGLI